MTRLVKSRSDYQNPECRQVHHSPDNTMRSESVWRPFEEIAATYDRVNRIVSFGRDKAWRVHIAKKLKQATCARLLDLATGTGDILLQATCDGAGDELAVGGDLSLEMLALAQVKVRQSGCAAPYSFVRSDALVSPFQDETFDAITMAFGLRNVAYPAQCLREMWRVLRPGGRTLILEFSLPASRLIRIGYLLYLRHILPYIGGLISGNLDAYRYLNQSIEAFPYGQTLCKVIGEAGFINVRATPLTFGVATLYEGTRPETLSNRNVVRE